MKDLNIFFDKHTMAETKKSHEKDDISIEPPKYSEKHATSSNSSDKNSNEIQTDDPYAENAKHKKYWRSLQTFKPLRFSR